jgi:hypothetical protein
VAYNGGNLGPPPATLAYTVESSLTVGGAGVLRWETDPVDKTAKQIVAAEFAAMRGARQAEPVRDVAKGFLQSALKDGPVAVDVLKAGAAALNLGWRTVARAKKDLGVKSLKTGFEKDAPWVWELPAP